MKRILNLFVALFGLLVLAASALANEKFTPNESSCADVRDASREFGYSDKPMPNALKKKYITCTEWYYPDRARADKNFGEKYLATVMKERKIMHQAYGGRN